LLPGFALAAEIPAVARICQLLNGLPLGIELSAAWVRAHDCQAIASQIEQDLDFLTSEMRDTPERHRSLRAVFEHSWKLLPPGLQPVFARLTAFRGGFTPEAARQICEAQPVQLAALVESSLLRKTAPARFELHSLLAQFASEKLHANPHETQTVQARHSRYYAGWLAQQSPKIHGPRQQTSLAQIALEIENARVAWQWAVAQGEAGLIEQSLPALSNFYLMRSRFQEGRDLFASAYISLSKAESGSSPQRLAALLAIQQGGFEIHLGNYEAARSLAESALAALHTNGAGAEIAAALDLQASTAIELGEYQQAKSICTEGLALLQAQNDLPLRAIFYNNLGDVQRVLGNYDEAQAQYQEMLAIYEHLQDDWGLARAYNSLGILAGTRGQYPAAQAYFEKSMTTFRGIGDRSGTARILHNLSILAYLDQDYEKTRQLRHECLEICREIGFQWGITSELKHLADVEKVLGDYSQARAHYEESLRYSQRAGDRKGMAYALDSLGGLDLLQNDLTMARNHYFEALNIAREIEMLPVVVDTLCGIAELLAQAGQPATAIELLSFAARHPASDKQTSAKAEALLATLIEKMPAEAATALRQQGAEATLETLLEKIQGIEIS
jgi:tetratricopeptide (TPR) repeat protein